MDVLISAGATRNPIDAMRYLTAGSSGSTGVFIARELAARGVRPWLIGSGEARLRGPEVPGEEFWSTRDLLARMQRWIEAHPGGAVIHSAAVGDYERADPNASKTPSGMAEWTLMLTPTPKIADRIRGWGCTGVYVTFKAAAPETTDEELVAIAARQRLRTGSDFVFANVLGRIGHRVAWVGEEAQWHEQRSTAVSALVDTVCERIGSPPQ